MATAKRLPSGSYRVRVWVNDIKAYKSFTADTKRAAERMANEWLIDHEEEVRREHTLTFEKAARVISAAGTEVCFRAAKSRGYP